MASTMKKIYAMLGAVFALFGASLFAENGKIEILDLVMLFDENVERQAQDLKKMSAEKVADVHMISFFLVPEGNPPFDKISLYEDKYRRLRAAIGDADCKTGIILQATLGHGFELEVPHPFQKMVSRENGREAWMKNIVCPLDENFRKYVRDCVVRIAKLKPCVIMVDDDFRIMGGRNGCLCPLHLAKIKKEFGYDLTREQLKKHLRGNSESDRKISDAAMKVNGESLIELAKIIREAIDSVDPSIQCLMCGSPDDMLHDGDIARALAAKGMPATLRIGNARYYNPKYRDLYHTARQLAVQNAIAKPDRVYAEIDTYPRNRYFTSARTLHAGLVVSILEGATGAKYWPNRFVDYEPDSGIEYKKILAENRGAYDTLAAGNEKRKIRGTFGNRNPRAQNPSPRFRAAYGRRLLLEPNYRRYGSSRFLFRNIEARPPRARSRTHRRRAIRRTNQKNSRPRLRSRRRRRNGIPKARLRKISRRKNFPLG